MEAKASPFFLPSRQPGKSSRGFCLRNHYGRITNLGLYMIAITKYVSLVSVIVIPLWVLCSSSRALEAVDTAAGVISNKRGADITATLTNSTGAFVAGTNSFCIAFQHTNGGAPQTVHDASAEFTLLVGRVQGRSIRVPLHEKSAGRHCGDIDLGFQYYRPANYAIVVRYSDDSEKRKHVRLRASVR